MYDYRNGEIKAKRFVLFIQSRFDTTTKKQNRGECPQGEYPVRSAKGKAGLSSADPDNYRWQDDKTPSVDPKMTKNRLTKNPVVIGSVIGGLGLTGVGLYNMNKETKEKKENDKNRKEKDKKAQQNFQEYEKEVEALKQKQERGEMSMKEYERAVNRSTYAMEDRHRQIWN